MASGWIRRSSASTRNRSAAIGLRSWWDASATIRRCRSSASATASDMPLNSPASALSSGGPAPTATRVCREPAATARTPDSSSPIGRRIHRATTRASTPQAASALTAPSAISAHWREMSAAAARTDTRITTAPVTRVPLPTGRWRSTSSPDHGRSGASCPDGSLRNAWSIGSATSAARSPPVSTIGPRSASTTTSGSP